MSVVEITKGALPAFFPPLTLDGAWRRIPDLARMRLRAAAWRRYRPECHYMRGPGPACQRKIDALAGAGRD